MNPTTDGEVQVQSSPPPATPTPPGKTPVPGVDVQGGPTQRDRKPRTPPPPAWYTTPPALATFALVALVAELGVYAILGLWWWLALNLAALVAATALAIYRPRRRAGRRGGGPLRRGERTGGSGGGRWPGRAAGATPRRPPPTPGRLARLRSRFPTLRGRGPRGSGPTAGSRQPPRTGLRRFLPQLPLRRSRRPEGPAGRRDPLGTSAGWFRNLLPTIRRRNQPAPRRKDTGTSGGSRPPTSAPPTSPRSRPDQPHRPRPPGQEPTPPPRPTRPPRSDPATPATPTSNPDQQPQGDPVTDPIPYADDQSLQRFGANLTALEAAAAEVRARYAQAEAAAARYTQALGRIRTQGETELPLAPRVQAELDALHHRATTATTADDWGHVETDAATLPHRYRNEHETDDDRLHTPRKSHAAEARADVSHASQDN